MLPILINSVYGITLEQVSFQLQLIKTHIAMKNHAKSSG